MFSTSSSQARSRSLTSRAPIHQTIGWNQNTHSTTTWMSARRLSPRDVAEFVRQDGVDLPGRQPFCQSLAPQEGRVTDPDDSRLAGGSAHHDGHTLSPAWRRGRVCAAATRRSSSGLAIREECDRERHWGQRHT